MVAGFYGDARNVVFSILFLFFVVFIWSSQMWLFLFFPMFCSFLSCLQIYTKTTKTYKKLHESTENDKKLQNTRQQTEKVTSQESTTDVEKTRQKNNFCSFLLCLEINKKVNKKQIDAVLRKSKKSRLKANKNTPPKSTRPLRNYIRPRMASFGVPAGSAWLGSARRPLVGQGLGFVGAWSHQFFGGGKVRECFPGCIFVD